MKEHGGEDKTGVTKEDSSSKVRQTEQGRERHRKRKEIGRVGQMLQ